eukprot:2771764-Pyramimonas_sp.AAC.1
MGSQRSRRPRRSLLPPTGGAVADNQMDSWSNKWQAHRVSAAATRAQPFTDVSDGPQDDHGTNECDVDHLADCTDELSS